MKATNRACCIALVAVVLFSCTSNLFVWRAHGFEIPLQRVVPPVVTVSGSVADVLQKCSVVDPSSGKTVGALDGLPIRRPEKNLIENALIPDNAKSLVIVTPQLGDFDTFEVAEQLVACLPELNAAQIKLRIIGIGDAKSARKFCEFCELPLEYMRVDKEAAIHKALNLHQGPNWDVPLWVPSIALEWFKNYTGASPQADETLVARSWLNYMAMCAGISAPDTLKEILRGYLGDQTAPERLRQDETVTVGGEDELIVIQGTTNVKLGPIRYQSLWKNEEGYQRPAELATVRLRNMVEVLENLSDYVPDQTHLAWRGATFLLDDNGEILYEHRDTGVLAYSETMARPLSFLEPYIGKEKARNPLGLGDKNNAPPAES